MWKLFVIVISVLCAGCASVDSTKFSDRTPSSTDLTEPRLFIKPAPLFDMLCQQTPFKIDPTLQLKLRSELNKKLDHFQSEWAKNAAALISESERAAGRKFNRKEYSVALTLCNWTPMGDPTLIVGASPFLVEPMKYKGFDLPLSMDAFVSMTHHELLHSLVDNIENDEFANASALLEKYLCLQNKAG